MLCIGSMYAYADRYEGSTEVIAYIEESQSDTSQNESSDGASQPPSPKADTSSSVSVQKDDKTVTTGYMTNVGIYVLLILLLLTAGLLFLIMLKINRNTVKNDS